MHLTTFRGTVTVHTGDVRTRAEVSEEEACRRIVAHDDLLDRLKGILAAFDANDSHGIREEIEASRADIAKAEGP